MSVSKAASVGALDLDPVLVAAAYPRERHPRLAIAQDQQAARRRTLGQDVAAQGGGQRQEPRSQRGEDGFAKGGFETFPALFARKRLY